jgi:hypothetical protein
MPQLAGVFVLAALPFGAVEPWKALNRRRVCPAQPRVPSSVRHHTPEGIAVEAEHRLPARNEN